MLHYWLEQYIAIQGDDCQLEQCSPRGKQLTKTNLDNTRERRLSQRGLCRRRSPPMEFQIRLTDHRLAGLNGRNKTWRSFIINLHLPVDTNDSRCLDMMEKIVEIIESKMETM